MSKYNAFSIAEAMVTLLIVSVALAAMAPIMSRKMINDVSASKSELPAGAVMAFDLNTCPAGWEPLTKTYADASGAFFRNLGTNADERGTLQLDAAPNLTFQFSMDDVMASYGFGGNAGRLLYGGTAISLKASTDDHWSGSIASFDASRASASYGRESTTEIRPRNIALLYCRKN